MLTNTFRCLVHSSGKLYSIGRKIINNEENIKKTENVYVLERAFRQQEKYIKKFVKEINKQNKLWRESRKSPIDNDPWSSIP